MKTRRLGLKYRIYVLEDCYIVSSIVESGYKHSMTAISERLRN